MTITKLQGLPSRYVGDHHERQLRYEFYTIRSCQAQQHFTACGCGNLLVYPVRCIFQNARQKDADNLLFKKIIFSSRVVHNVFLLQEVPCSDLIRIQRGHSLVLDTKLIPWIRVISAHIKLIQCIDKINSSCALEWSFPGRGYQINSVDTSNTRVNTFPNIRERDRLTRAWIA